MMHMHENIIIKPVMFYTNLKLKMNNNKKGKMEKSSK